MKQRGVVCVAPEGSDVRPKVTVPRKYTFYREVTKRIEIWFHCNQSQPLQNHCIIHKKYWASPLPPASNNLLLQDNEPQDNEILNQIQKANLCDSGKL